eukprot:GEMP01013945.1.p1 GENE.GEMP01013945.1~~GEMP01013945.1.p1  ORF type:complete len:901 (+),score=165.88 GEMP01013945.1:34-2736(+)
MRVLWSYALPVQLLRLCSTVSDGAPVQSPDPSSTKSDRARYVDDIFSHSGGVRVHNMELRPNGLVVYDQFLAAERKAQRAFIWHRLKLGDINFVRKGDTSWVTQKKERTSVARYLKQAHGLARSPLKTWLSFVLFQFPHDRYPHLSMEHMRNIKWNWDCVPILRDSMLHYPRYNDMPGAAREHHADPDARYAFNDPRYLGNDAVVNYRISWRDLLEERFDILDLHHYSLVDDELDHLFERAVEITASRKSDARFHVKMLDAELTRCGPDTIDIDINVNAILQNNIAPDDMYTFIWKAINAQIESVYQSESRSVVEATRVLGDIADKETVTANKYRKFNDPQSRDMNRVQFESNAPMRDNIEEVYQRAVVRRQEFHKMTEPFVLNTDGAPTYRVHFTDPELRYVDSDAAVVEPKSKQWYKALWKRLLEPVFKDAIIEEVKDIRLRNIVLTHSGSVDQGDAYTSNGGEDMIIHCVDLDENHAYADYLIRHEYEHTIDSATKSRTTKLYAEMEDEDDPRTLTLETLNEILQKIDSPMETLDLARGEDTRAHAQGADLTRVTANVETAQQEDDTLKARRAMYEFARTNLEDNTWRHVFNVDECTGFPSCYAQDSVGEAVAEQRYAMRNEAIRIALLRRMSLYRTRDAARQKGFYDRARMVMEFVAPQLYEQWGTYYDDVNPEFWGLLPGKTKKVGKHYQIMTLDHSLATKVASEKLATYFLQRGYDVAIMSAALPRKRVGAAGLATFMPSAECILQSNSKVRNPEFRLYLVGGSAMRAEDVVRCIIRTFTDFTPTGRRVRLFSMPYTPDFKAVFFVPQPYGPYRRSAADNAKFMADFGKEFGFRYRLLRLPRISLHEGVTVGDEIMWPQDQNLYRETIFEGWYVGDKEVWEQVDIEAHSNCMQI